MFSKLYIHKKSFQERNGEVHPARPGGGQINPSLADIDTGGMPVKKPKGTIPLVSELVSKIGHTKHISVQNREEYHLR